MHGTTEAPAFLESLVCHLLGSGRAVLLGLEYPTSEQAFLDDYLRKPSGQGEDQLLESPFWTRYMQDGRSSQAMLQLLQSLRADIARGAHLRIVAIDAPVSRAAAGISYANARDAAMAAQMRREIARSKADVVPVVFVGNVHARKTSGLPFPGAPADMQDAQPLGYVLKGLGLTHLNIGARGGSLWTCTPGCGATRTGEPVPAISHVVLRPSADPAYDSEYYVGPLTASLPANPAFRP